MSLGCRFHQRLRLLSAVPVSIWHTAFRRAQKFARSGKREAKSRIILPGMKITLIALGVSDVAKSVAFYRDKAGFELQHQFGSLAFFLAGPVNVDAEWRLRARTVRSAGAMEIVVAAESVTASRRQLVGARLHVYQ